MAESTAVNPNEYTLLNEIVSNASIHASTPLYNTWPIAALPHVPGQIRQLVMDPLYATSYDSEHAINSNFAGFFRVEKFEAEANVMFDLDLVDPSIGLCRPGSSRNWTSPLKPCQKCAKGRFKEDGWDPDRFGAELCHACPPGSYSDEIGLAHCKECPEGKITYEYGQTQCQDSTANSVYHPIEGCAVLPNRTLIVGVLKDISVERTMSEWRPTFQDLLNQNFNRYRCYFEMKALDWQEMTQAVERGAIDLVFSDPGLFVLYELHHGLSAVASVLRLKGGRANPFRAGVIIRSAALNKDLTTLQDVASAGASRSLSACPVNEDSFEGWQAQWFEFFKAGLDVKKIFKSVNFTGSHTVTAALVATGACDVGFMGSDTLSLLAEADVWEIETFAIINKRSHENVGFIAKASTDLYPDWVLSSSPRVGEEILKLLEAPLLSLQLPHPAAIAGSYAGFTLPLDYRGVAQVRYELDLMDPVLGLCPPGSSRNWSSPLKPCQKCAKGRSKEDGWDADRFGAELCHACAPGSYSDEIGLAHCKRCPEGKITYEYGQIECVKSGDVFLFAKIEACAAFLNNTLTVGVLSDINKSETTMQWKPTFEDLLNHFLNRYHCFFKMVVMDWREMTQAVKTQEVDLVFADPGLVVAYERKYNTKAVATVLRVFDGFIYPSTAGVIFRSSSRNEDLVTLQDVANAARSRTLTACPVHEDSFEGWQAQWYEFFKAGLDIDQVLLVKTFTDSHEESARLVATGACDVGFASSNTLEKLAAEDVFEIETFFIINRRKHSGFISASSTDLYPQWTLAVLPHVSQAIVGVVDVPLRSLEESDEASIIGQLAGFTAPKDYSSVAQVRFQLGVEPLNSCGPGAYRNVAANLNPCVPCPAGWVSKDGVGSCTACPIGYVAPLNGSSTCEQCDFGFLTEEAGSTTCVPYEAEIIMNHMAQISVCVLVAIVFWFCVTMLFLVVAYRNTKLMKASSSIFNVVIVTGAILVSASTLLFTVMPANDWICSLRCKTYRLFKIFQIYERKQKIPQAIKFKDIKLPVTQPVARMAVRSLALLIGAATPVVVLYVPKVVSIWKDQQNDSKFSTNHSNTNTNINNQELISQAKSQQVYTDSKVTMTSPAIEDRNLVVEKSHRSALSNISGLSDNEIEEAMENMQLEIFPSEQLSGDEGYFYCAPADFRLANVVIPRTSASRTSASPSSTSRRCKVTSARAANAPVSGTPSTSRQRLQVNVSAEMTTLSTPPSASRRTPKATPPHTTPPSATGALQSVAELVPQLAQADATELSELPMDRLVVRSATAPSELSRLDEAAKQSTHDPAASDTSIPGLDHDPSPDPSPNPSLSPKFANATVSLRTGRNASRENNVEEIKGGSPQLAEVAYPTFSSRSASPRVQPRRSMDHPRNDSGSGTLQMASPRETGPAFMRSVPGGGSPSVASLPMASDPLRRSNSADLRAKVRYQGGRTPSSATSKLQHRMNLITLALGTGAEDNLDDNDDEPNLVA
eukprot:g73921.t1